MADRTLTAMYDTKGAAESARDDLIALGISSTNVTLRGSESGSSTSSASSTTEDKGFLDSLADLFFPEEDQHTYAEGVRRGGYLLSVRVSDDMEDRAREALERSGPVDIDERAESWRQSGWAGYQASGTGPAGATTAASRDYGTAGSGLEAATVRTGENEDVVERVEEE